jgi:hypothetical protein
MNASTMKESNDKVDIAVMAERIRNIQQTVANIEALLASKYVTRDEFNPVRNVAFGIVGIILTAVAIAIISLVIKK